MKKNSDRKAFRLLSTLNAEEKKEFVKSWDGPPGAKEILEIYLKNPEIEIDQAFSEKNFNYSSFLVQQNKIINALEEFIILKEIESNDFLKHLLRLKRLNRAFDKRLFEEYLRKAEKIFESQPKRGVSYYQAMYELTAEKQTHYIKEPAKRISFASELNYFNKMKRWLEIIYLGIMNKNLYRSTNGQHKYEKILPGTLEAIRDSKESKSGILQLLLSFYDLLSDNEDINEVISLLEKNHEKDDKSVISDLYSLALNHLMQKAWKDTGIDTNESLSNLLNAGIQSQYLFTEGVINLSFYSSYIKSNCLVGNIKEVEKNAEKYAKFLGPDVEEYGFSYGKILINYFKRNYKEVSIKDKAFTKKELNPLQIVQFDFMIAESLYFLNDIEKVDKKLRNIGLRLNRNSFRNPKTHEIIVKRLDLFKMFMNASSRKEIQDVRIAFQKSDLPFNHRYFFNEVLFE